MFTGIIEGKGRVSKVAKKGAGILLGIQTDFSIADSKIGDSIAINGACLTAISIGFFSFEAYLSPETCKITTFGSIRQGDTVNVERALKLSDRIDGHMVSGHIDGIGTLKNKESASDAILLAFTVPAILAKHMIKKGSVAVDGVSLTINECGDDFFSVSIIPHTGEITTITAKKPGDKVNIETDMIGKYIEKFIAEKNDKDIGSKSKIDMNFLAETGFLNQ